ncbi:MAG: LysR family transcriptional regulator [Deltaproteobacteria bacterium]|nr:LysR family transcriptional regulator [Deltaproteobacteria bacterium]
MKIDHLKYFIETAKQEHIGKASKIVGTSPSNISHGITQLEEEFGRKLFTKQGRRIFLTTHGKFLQERVEGLLNEIETLKKDISSDDVQHRGYFRIAASHFLCSKLLTPAWAALQAESPKISGEIFTLRSADVVRGAANGEIDLGICFSPVDNPDIQRHELSTGQLFICARKEHALLGSTSKAATKWSNDISKYPALMPKAFQGIEVCATHPVLKKFHISPRITCYYDSYDVAIEKMVFSESWGFLPDWVISRSDGRIKTIRHPKDWNAPYEITAIYPRNRVLPAAMRNLLAKVQAELSPLQQPKDIR